MKSKKSPSTARAEKPKKGPRPKAKGEKAEKKAKAGISDTTRRQLVGLVHEYDANLKDLEELKGVRSTLKGQIQTSQEEIDKTILDEEIPDGDARKKLAGLERDVRRWKIKLAGVEETMSGHKESAKGCRVGIFDLIRDLDKGALLFDQKDKPKGDANIPASIATGERVESVGVKAGLDKAASGTPAPTKSPDVDSLDIPTPVARALMLAGVQSVADFKQWREQRMANGLFGRASELKVHPDQLRQADEALLAAIA